MSHSLPPRDGDSDDNAPSTLDGGVGGGVPYDDNVIKIKQLVVTRVKKENVQLPTLMMRRRSPIIKINYTVPMMMMMINLAVIINPRHQNRRLVIYTTNYGCWLIVIILVCSRG